MINPAIKTLFLSLFFFASSIQSKNATAEIRAGYFYPSTHVMRDIYKEGGFEFEAEGSYRFYKRLSAWFNLSLFVRDGHSLGLSKKTSLQLYPLSAGVKYTFSDNGKFSPYFGLGANYTFATVHENVPLPLKNTLHKHGGGVVVKSGLNISFCHKWYVDIFTDYCYTNVATNTRPINIGGFRAGIGLGMNF